MRLPSALALASCLAFAAGCATQCPDAPAQVAQQRFACADGARLDVTFDRASGRALVSEDGGAALSLAVQVAGVGYRYIGDGAELRSGTNAAEALWTPPAEHVGLPGEPAPSRAHVKCTIVD